MAKGVGLDTGAFEVKVVELDGSYRKPRLSKVSIDRVVADAGADSDRNEADAALQALKEADISKDGVVLGFACREAVLRNLTVPFVGDDAIRKVLKFEAEGSIHSHSVDDMVVDFHTLERLDGETRVLVAAVPKKVLGAQLDALESVGIEPERVDLDTMALLRVAEWAGCFGEDAAEAAAQAAESADGELDLDAVEALTVGSGVPGQPERARVIVDVGARSTRVLAVVNGKLVDMRALRVGDDALAAELAETCGVPIEVARDAVREGVPPAPVEAPALPAGEDETAADADAASLDEGEFVLEDESPPEKPTLPLTEERIRTARDRFLMRLRRELMRFLTALPRVSGVERVFVTGGGSRLEGVHQLLADVFGAPIQELDVLGRLIHDLDDDEVRVIGPRVATAVGLALSTMGRRDGFDFRQEELAYKKRFDRVKFPLAIACLLAIFLPLLYGLRKYKQLDLNSKRYGELYQVAGGEEGGRGSTRVRAEFWGFVGALMNVNGQYSLQRVLGNQEFEKLTENVIERPTFERLRYIRSALNTHLRKEQESTGVYQDLQLPSGVYVLSYWADVIAEVEKRIGPFLITELEMNLHQQAKSRFLQFRIAIRGDNFRDRFTVLEDAFQLRFADPACPFEGFQKARDPEVFVDPEVPGSFYEMKLSMKESFLQEIER